MCRLDDEVRSWREDLQGKGWFSPLELNELEDHLRSHAAEERESGPAPGSAAAFEAAVREEIGDPTRLFREYARSEAPVWRSVLLTGWGLYALSLLLPGFGIVAFQPSSPSFGVSAAGWEFLWLALGNGWIVELLPNLAMAMTLPLLGRSPTPDGGVGGASPRSSGSSPPSDSGYSISCARFRSRSMATSSCTGISVPPTGCGPGRSRLWPPLCGCAPASGPSPDRESRSPRKRDFWSSR